MSPGSLEPGSSSTLTFIGVGLDRVTGIRVAPADGLTVGALTASADGTSLTVQVTADAAASRAPHAIVPVTASGPATLAAGRTNVLYVGLRPVITSLSTNLQNVGNTFTFTVNGTSLDGTTTVRFEPADGITVINPPTINATGTQATVTVVIDGMASGGQRVVVIEGPYGASDNTSGANNTFTVNKPVIAAASGIMTASEPSRVGFVEAIASGWPGTAGLFALADSAMPGIPVWRQPVSAPLPGPEPLRQKEGEERGGPYPFRVDDRAPLLMAAMTSRGYRGPPGSDDRLLRDIDTISKG
jgi:hypothetical protein